MTKITHDAADAVGKTQLTEGRVTHTKEYMHKDIPDGTEICMLKHPLTAEEWNQILQNQEIVSRLPELLRTFLTDIATGMELDDDEIKNMINSTVKAWMGK